MLTASAAYTAALRQSHLARFRVRAYRRDEDGNRTLIGTVPVVSGSVTVDGQANAWHTASLQVANDVIYPDGTTWADLLNAYDTDLKVDYGIQTDYDLDAISPVVEYVQVALLRVDSAVAAQAGAIVAVQASDDGTRVTDYPIETPWPAVGDDDLDKSVVDTIKALVNACYPDGAHPTWHVSGDVTDTAWPAYSVFQGDRWQAVNSLAETIGAWVHVDSTGDWVIDPTPTELAVTPDWAFAAGDDGTLITADTGTDRTEMFNKVTVRFELPFAGSQSATATDTSPTSPTRWDGPMGRKPTIVDNDTCATTAEAQKAADALLAQYRGRGRQISLDAVYCPLLEPGDTIQIDLPDGGSETHWVDSLTLPIPAGQMSLRTRVVDVTT